MLEFLDTGDFWAGRGSGYRLPYFVPQASAAVICLRRRRDTVQQNTVAFMRRVELYVNNGEGDDSSSRVAHSRFLLGRGSVIITVPPSYRAWRKHCNHFSPHPTYAILPATALSSFPPANTTATNLPLSHCYNL